METFDIPLPSKTNELKKMQKLGFESGKKLPKNTMIKHTFSNSEKESSVDKYEIYVNKKLFAKVVSGWDYYYGGSTTYDFLE